MSKLEEISCVEHPASLKELNAERYLMANPDVKAVGMDPVEHFEEYGLREGRVQYAPMDVVSDLREKKIQGLKFRDMPSRTREHGKPIDFLTDEVIDQFKISPEPPVSSNQYSEELVNEFRENPDKLFLDVGAGLRHKCFSNVVNTEIYPSISTDVVCIGEELPFEDEQFDKVICFAVLEHTRRPWEVAKEICRVLKPGGKVMIDYPFLQPVHGYPYHYFNATPEGNISLFEEYCEIDKCEVHPHQSPIFSLHWFLNLWAEGLNEGDREAFKKISVGDILSQAPVGHLDQFYCKNLSKKTEMLIPAGTLLSATKK